MSVRFASLVVAASLINAPAAAQDTAQSAIISVGYAEAASAAGLLAGAGSHVRIGRDLDLEGRMLVAVRPPADRIATGPGEPLPTESPLAAARMTSSFGLRTHPLMGGLRLHRGIDLAAPLGTPIHATSAGRVDMAGWLGGYGLAVELDHGVGIQTRYGHMSRLAVGRGQLVAQGDVIGWVGSTGRSTGPHLHYEVRRNGRAIEPPKMRTMHVE